MRTQCDWGNSSGLHRVLGVAAADGSSHFYVSAGPVDRFNLWLWQRHASPASHISARNRLSRILALPSYSFHVSLLNPTLPGAGRGEGVLERRQRRRQARPPTPGPAPPRPSSPRPPPAARRPRRPCRRPGETGRERERRDGASEQARERGE